MTENEKPHHSYQQIHTVRGRSNGRYFRGGRRNRWRNKGQNRTEQNTLSNNQSRAQSETQQGEDKANLN